MKYTIKNIKNVPFFLYATGEGSEQGLGDLLITPNVPGSVRSSKGIVRLGTQQPGGEADIQRFGALTSTRVDFTLTLAHFNGTVGAGHYKTFLDSLSRPKYSGNSPVYYLNPPPFTPNPRVLAYYSMGTTVPLWYHVTGVDVTLSNANKLGRAQVLEARISLVMDETGALAKVENFYRRTVGRAFNLAGSVKNLTGGGHPYVGGSGALL